MGYPQVLIGQEGLHKVCLNGWIIFFKLQNELNLNYRAILVL